MKPVLDAKSLDQSIHRSVTAGVIVIAALVAVGGWSTATEISGAVVASGNIAVDSNVKHVQHPDGGVVKEIHVRDGDEVTEGQILVRLDDTETRANLAISKNRLNNLFLRRSRLEAEINDASVIEVPLELQHLSNDLEFRKALREQQSLLLSRRSSLQGRVDQFNEQINQFNTHARGLDIQIEARNQEKTLIEEELVSLKTLLDKKLTPRARFVEKKRQEAQILGDIGRLTADKSSLLESISERRIQILQVQEQSRSQALEELQDVRLTIDRISEEVIKAEAVLKRIDITSPQTGYIHQSTVDTIGQVIPPGKDIMQIVPVGDLLVINARIKTTDIDQVFSGQEAIVRFPALNQRITPELKASVDVVSGDQIIDQATQVPYYSVKLRFLPGEFEKLGDKLVPGMPVESFIRKSDRTILSYLLKPMTDSIAHAFLE